MGWLLWLLQRLRMWLAQALGSAAEDEDADYRANVYWEDR